MLIQLTHPEPNYDFWVESSEITVMERYTRPASTLLTLQDDRPNVTAIVLRSGKIMSCKETPAQVMQIMKGNS
jgi:hypothetical protein